MDLLLDAGVVLEACRPRPDAAATVNAAMAHCRQAGGQVWLYAGAVESLHEGLAAQLAHADDTPDTDAARRQARAALAAFCDDKQWLAALAGDCAVWAEDSPANGQLLRALRRFPAGRVRLLTRETSLLTQCAEAMTPEAFLALPLPAPAIPFIDLAARQHAIRPQLEENLHRVLHHGQYILGPEVQALEHALAEYVGVAHCLTVASGTDALLIALMALGIGPGDEVITSPFTFIATAEVIALLGAKPVFVDIDPVTYNLDPALLESAITPRTRALMPVSLYGQCADFDAINAIAAAHQLPVIEDAAQSFGATYRGRRSCGLSLIGCTSFFPSKPLGGYGDGGACFTSDATLAKRMGEIRVHGQDRRYHHPLLGLNGRLDSLQCAALLARWPQFAQEVASREKLGTRYTTLIDAAAQGRVAAPRVLAGNTSVYAQYTVQVDDRDGVQARLNAQGIPTAVHYPVPLHLQPVFAGLRRGAGSFPVAEAAAARVLSLPLSPDLTPAQQDVIVRALLETLAPVAGNA